MGKNPKLNRQVGCRMFTTCSIGRETAAVDDEVVMLVWGIDIVAGA